MSSRNKPFKENIEGLHEEDENEHARLLKEQEEYEIQSMSKMPRLDNSEYARMIEMSENLGRGDVKIDDLEISDDEEEKQPQNNRKDSKEIYELSGRDEEEDKDEAEDYSQKISGKQKNLLSPATPILTRSTHSHLRVSYREQHLPEIRSQMTSIKLHKDVRMLFFW